MRIIVTGGAGFIGSHIVDAYLAAGHQVLVIDNLFEHGGGRRENLDPRASFANRDIGDPSLVDIFRDFRPDIVSHHAAQASVAIGSRDPQFDARVNVLGLLNVLDATSAVGARKVIFASSGAIYGEPVELPMTEATLQVPTSPYGISKMVAEHYLRFYHAERGLDFTALRYGNVYGPRQDPEGEAGVIAIFLGKFLAGEGVRIDSDGEQTRDYVYVGDVVAANIAALERGGGKSYVIATGRRTSVNEIYRTLIEVTGFTAPLQYCPKRPGDVRDAQFDTTLARRDLGWEPKVSLREGFAHTHEFFRAKAGAKAHT
ncbi:MAG TPA: NAD-dependent epimerase/dehydratase family protein [Candidatus Baltobacteraceae bacterium]|jgi:UDP-glucose 4-epimerase|nr:NAD-dependent epimerase/dehydratase family protein [Candidatus Baltobacteraceae bacterium]